MPRARPRGSFERSVGADLFKHTLSQIPSLYGRLSYLASLRDPNSGVYHHYGMVARFGREESAKAMTESHEQVFREWLALPLAAKHADLTLYFEAQRVAVATVLGHWQHTKLYHSLVPPGASEAEKEFFSKDLAVLIETLNFSAGDTQDRASSPPE